MQGMKEGHPSGGLTVAKPYGNDATIVRLPARRVLGEFVY